MQFYKKTDFSTIAVHSLFGIALLCLRFVGTQSEPYGIALSYAMCYAGLSPICACACYALSYLLLPDLTLIMIAIGQAALLFFAFWIQKRLPTSNFQKSNS